VFGEGAKGRKGKNVETKRVGLTGGGRRSKLQRLRGCTPAGVEKPEESTFTQKSAQKRAPCSEMKVGPLRPCTERGKGYRKKGGQYQTGEGKDKASLFGQVKGAPKKEKKKDRTANGGEAQEKKQCIIRKG